MVGVHDSSPQYYINSVLSSQCFHHCYYVYLILLFYFCSSRTMWGWGYWAVVLRRLFSGHVNLLLLLQQTASGPSSGDIALIRRIFRESIKYWHVGLTTAFWSSPSNVTQTIHRFVTTYTNWHTRIWKWIITFPRNEVFVDNIVHRKYWNYQPDTRIGP